MSEAVRERGTRRVGAVKGLTDGIAAVGNGIESNSQERTKTAAVPTVLC